MKKIPFPWLATGLGALLAIALERSGAMNPDIENRLPLLTLLVMSEFGFIVTAVGAGLGLRTLLRREGGGVLYFAVLACVLFAVVFLWLGIQLWPGDFVRQ